MNKAKLLFAILLAVGASACSELVTFDRDKIAVTDAGSAPVDDDAMSGSQVHEDEAGQPNMDGDVIDTGPDLRCEPGTAGEACEPCKAGQYCAGGAAPGASLR